MASGGTEPSVLGMIVGSLGRIEVKLDSKAGRDDVARVEVKVDGHEARLVALEESDATAAAVLRHKRSTWATAGYLVALGAALGTCAGTLLAVH